MPTFRRLRVLWRCWHKLLKHAEARRRSRTPGLREHLVNLAMRAGRFDALLRRRGVDGGLPRPWADVHAKATDLLACLRRWAAFAADASFGADDNNSGGGGSSGGGANGGSGVDQPLFFLDNRAAGFNNEEGGANEDEDDAKAPGGGDALADELTGDLDGVFQAGGASAKKKMSAAPRNSSKKSARKNKAAARPSGDASGAD